MALYNTALLATYDTKKWKDQLRSFVTSSEIIKDLFKLQTLTEPKLVLSL
jgi:hypothetical protein